MAAYYTGLLLVEELLKTHRCRIWIVGEIVCRKLKQLADMMNWVHSLI